MAPGLPRAVTDGLDDQTAAVVIEIQLQDVSQLLESQRRKSAGRPSDFVQTLLLQKEELQTALASINDRRMSRSMACAVLADSQAIERFVAQERLAETDRAYACRLGGVAIPPPSNRHTPPQTPRNGPPTHPARLPATRPQPRQPNFRPEPTPPQTPRAPASGFGRQETPTPSAPRPAGPRANTSVPPPPLPQPPASRTPSTNIQGQKVSTPSVVGGAQRQIPRAAPNVKPLAQYAMRTLEENKPPTVPTLAKSFVPSPHPDAKTVNSSAAGLDVKQSESIKSIENRISKVSPGSFQPVLKEVISENKKPLQDVTPKTAAALENTAQHTNASTSVQTSIIIGKRAQEDISDDTSTAKRQCTGKEKEPTKSCFVDHAGASTSIQPVAQAHANALKTGAL
ncbi:hypothetical protein LAWI1_G003336 [Lachnellula willkommii]|uniref:Uncharacterized protein n=1 Tax=Lachnellula willkommii TaxID=215461 RepID=A0A559MJ04_9HELO|nr:hypothetical protein LAWI1_G003336 [Lachnellula willkommii]